MSLSPEETLRSAIDLVVLGVEAAGAAVVAVGSVIALWRLGQGWVRRDDDALTLARISFGRVLALGLEFQLAGDILKTAVSPTWDAIGRLAAIAAIRTALNHFLAREIADGERSLAGRGVHRPSPSAQEAVAPR